MNDSAFILIVEDHAKIRTSTLVQLRDQGFYAHAVASAEEADAFLAEQESPPDLLLVDIRLGGASGIDFLKRRAAKHSPVPAIIITGEASISETVEALRLGVYDLIEKPFTRERLLQSVRNCLDHAVLKRELAAVKTHIHQRHTILGRSPQIAQLRERIERVAATGARALIRGESGTGKELVANTLHHLGARRDQPFIKINCAAIPAHLIEDELFGHARGAFTDAKFAKPGLFEEADRGSLFLDEIGDMELPLQSRLLRVLEDGKVRRVGENHDRQVDVRVIAATNRDLNEAIAAGAFRQDLYFRLATVPIDVPPLRERAGDVALLFSFFLESFCTEHQRRKLTVEPEVFAALDRYSWPGNVRELRNVCEQLAIFGADPITIDQMPSLLVARDAGTCEAGLLRFNDAVDVMPLREFKERCETEYIEAVLRRTNWNYTAAAKMLDIQRTYLHQKIVALKIQKPRR